MVTAHISLPDDQMARLRLLAIASRRCLDEVIRDAVDRYLANESEPAGTGTVNLPTPHVEPEARAAAVAALARLHAHVALDLTSEEIEQEITLAAEEARQERIARRERDRA